MILGCTHYPILFPKIREYTPDGIRVIAQGEYVGRKPKRLSAQTPGNGR